MHTSTNINGGDEMQKNENVGKSRTYNKKKNVYKF